MNELLQSIELFPLTASDIITRLVIAFLCGYAISWIYKWTYRGPGYLSGFANSLIVLSLITAVVLLVIGNNLARAFGLVGAMSIIRFRTAVKETQDIIFIFLSLAVGMAAGVGYFKIAIISTVFIGLVLKVLALREKDRGSSGEGLLQFRLSSENTDGENTFLPALEQYCKSWKLLNARAVGSEGAPLLEVAFFIELKSANESLQLLNTLNSILEIENATLLFDEERI
ncbi:MAG: DUF4956 domain-containing protein [Calditrichota bacterium]